MITELKIKLKNKNISVRFKIIFSLINNEKYSKIIEIINDNSIQFIINNIITERDKIGNNLEKNR